MPQCNNTVGQHSKTKNKNKQVCEAHRKTRKNEVDKWKLQQGCANHDGHYCFPCVSSTIIEPATLDINHKDGNNNNRDPSNIEVLCAMCHRTVTLREEHHLNQTKEDRRTKLAETGLFDFLN
jgi:hypothetical protein